MTPAMSASVIVPSYRRPDALKSCLGGLRKQQTRPAEVLVVVRDDDEATLNVARDVYADLPECRAVSVRRPGVVAAMQAALDEASGDIVAIIDDDAIPAPDWIQRITASFAMDDAIAGVGGRDRIYREGRLVDGTAKVVGRVQWFGRHVGNHHLGAGGPRDVHVLKGANCAFRRIVLKRIGFDARLLGTGAQVHWELSLGLTLLRHGWRLVYDPNIVVDHYPAPRFDVDQREGFNYEARFNEAHNETLVLLEHLHPAARPVFWTWAVSIGTRAVPGLLQLMRFAAFERRWIGAHVSAALSGRLAGRRTWLATRRVGDRLVPRPPESHD
jgi:cellulose synthase/poly-beta-1,6-N-acetylglucosamine synthase-like glycosyltransferase